VLFILDAGKPVGILHIHDLSKAGVACEFAAPFGKPLMKAPGSEPIFKDIFGKNRNARKNRIHQNIASDF
jgi:hypothetical protein